VTSRSQGSTCGSSRTPGPWSPSQLSFSSEPRDSRQIQARTPALGRFPAAFAFSTQRLRKPQTRLPQILTLTFLFEKAHCCYNIPTFKSPPASVCLSVCLCPFPGPPLEAKVNPVTWRSAWSLPGRPMVNCKFPGADGELHSPGRPMVNCKVPGADGELQSPGRPMVNCTAPGADGELQSPGSRW
jgi:hypothetical protein